MDIKWIGSPNRDPKEYRKPIRIVVCHWFGDQSTSHNMIGSVDNQFQKPGGTSAHYAVEKNTIHQYVLEEEVAWGAGQYSVNQESINIEHSGGPFRPVDTATYETSAKLIRDICDRYSIPIDRNHIRKHSNYFATQCPGTLDLDKLIALAKISDPCVKINDDIPTEIEDKYNLKSYPWYSKYWNFDEFIKKSIQDINDLDSLVVEYEDLLTAHGDLEIRYNDLNTRYERLKEEKDIDLKQALEFIIDYILKVVRNNG